MPRKQINQSGSQDSIYKLYTLVLISIVLLSSGTTHAVQPDQLAQTLSDYRNERVSSTVVSEQLLATVSSNAYKIDVGSYYSEVAELCGLAREKNDLEVLRVCVDNVVVPLINQHFGKAMDARVESGSKLYQDEATAIQQILGKLVGDSDLVDEMDIMAITPDFANIHSIGHLEVDCSPYMIPNGDSFGELVDELEMAGLKALFGFFKEKGVRYISSKGESSDRFFEILANDFRVRSTEASVDLFIPEGILANPAQASPQALFRNRRGIVLHLEGDDRDRIRGIFAALNQAPLRRLDSGATFSKPVLSPDRAKRGGFALTKMTQGLRRSMEAVGVSLDTEHAKEALERLDSFAAALPEMPHSTVVIKDVVGVGHENLSYFCTKRHLSRAAFNADGFNIKFSHPNLDDHCAKKYDDGQAAPDACKANNVLGVIEAN